MFEILETAPDIVAFRCADEMSKPDISRIMDLTERALARPGKVHFYAEIAHPKGLFAAMEGRWVRDLKFLLDIRRFGRVAIVSPDTWIRTVARIESALLPFLAYRVFEPAKRDDALAWVEGRRMLSTR